MTIKEYNFKKGVSGNPNGRPKGSFSPLRKQLLELRKLAINDASEIYQELREKMKSGEAWAYQIYFKELASMPKEWLNEVDTSNVFKDINNSKEFQHSKISLFQSLINNNSMSQDEILDLIKLLNNTKINDYILKDKKQNTILEDYNEITKEIGL
ncbi:MAG: hypothetical protein HQ490_02765 [Lutibacter sp.]|nr:hypothetical protein [Lutibacter sp.]